MSGDGTENLAGRYHGGNKDNLDQDNEYGVDRSFLHQLAIYIFNCVLLSLAWLLGVAGYSYAFIVLMLLLLMVVWRTKLVEILQEIIQVETLRVHRRRALRQSETAEWLNFIINRWWVFSHPSIFKHMKKHLDPLLVKAKPNFVDAIDLHSFHVGDQTPYVKFLKVYEVIDHLHVFPATPETVLKPPLGLGRDVTTYQLVFEADIGLHSPEFKMVLRARMGAKFMGIDVDVAVENLNVNGKAQVILHMNSHTAFPHIAKATISFVERPDVWFSVRVLKAVQLMEIPILKGWIHSLIMEALTTELVDPGKLDIKIVPEASYEPEKNKTKWYANGVITLTVSGTPTSKFNNDLEKDKVLIKVKGKRMLSSYTLATFEVNLSEHDLEMKNNIEITLQKKQIKLSLLMEYTPLESISLDNIDALPPIMDGQLAGVMYICVHSGSNLLAMDRTGKSDPYVIVFNNRQKVKTTHYICQTLNPKWEYSMEFFVADYTAATISFLVYDWDGRKITDNDFLGSCNLSLTKNLPLGFGMVGGAVMGNKLGTLCVSAVFRHVPSVAESEKLGRSNPELICAGDEDIAYSPRLKKKSANMITSAAKTLMTAGRSSPCKASVLNLGRGILELTIVRAKDLVAKDRNGYSDPYCEVKIKSHLKFKTSTIKNSLSPVWEESVTMELPNDDEVLDINVWDRDPFFKRDFLGCIGFTLDEVKSYSHAGPTWFSLRKIRSGCVQLKFNVITISESGMCGIGVCQSGTVLVCASLVQYWCVPVWYSIGVCQSGTYWCVPVWCNIGVCQSGAVLVCPVWCSIGVCQSGAVLVCASQEQYRCVPVWCSIGVVQSGAVFCGMYLNMIMIIILHNLSQMIHQKEFDGNEGGSSPFDDDEVFKMPESDSEVVVKKPLVDRRPTQEQETSSNSSGRHRVRKTKSSSLGSPRSMSNLPMDYESKHAIPKTPSDSTLHMLSSQECTPKKKKSKLRRVFSMKLRNEGEVPFNLQE
uniref:Uncharacterized protein LOC102802144 n=1 Tax=Saccoglossus kowalevskii TaxID=10224 RepID=A0ABM0M665_SACKO|nr:PREDICTED: uncharacterized protein LOC102802144 [Saccoglossus kowalevskii]